jgi:NAD-dependent dihydropyrimidine dehydrogenase PreA subunit
MKSVFFSREHTRTQFIQLDTRKCKACWKCLANCPNQVINKIDLPWHRHALIAKPDLCTGCLKCIKLCEYDAYSKIDRTQQETVKHRVKLFNKFIINNLILIFGVLMAFSGLTLQIGFHMGGTGEHHSKRHEIFPQSMTYEQVREIDPGKIVCGFNYSGWSAIHKISIICFSLLMVFHIYAHWKWYKGVITKHLINKNIMVITLSILFILAAITGLVPWFIDLSGSKSSLRLGFIEVHDKLTLILIVYLILHMVRKNKWFVSTYAKLRS